jgi:hypothetical protein
VKRGANGPRPTPNSQDEHKIKAKNPCLTPFLRNRRDFFSSLLEGAASTFKEIADLFLNEHVGPKRKKSTAQDYESLLTTYAIRRRTETTQDNPQ